MVERHDKCYKTWSVTVAPSSSSVQLSSFRPSVLRSVRPLSVSPPRRSLYAIITDFQIPFFLIQVLDWMDPQNERDREKSGRSESVEEVVVLLEKFH